MKRFLDLLSRRGRTAAPFDAPLAPERPVAVIGDVHGCDDLLARLLDRLRAEAPDHAVVLVGDLIDRGEQSDRVLRRLQDRPDLLCLRGNHEAMCVEFIHEPETFGPRWLWNGGLQTLASFGVPLPGAGAAPGALVQARDHLWAAMGEELVAWLHARPLVWRSGNLAVVHAGADPERPIEAQDTETLLWGHPRFREVPRADGIWVAYGHVIRPEPRAKEGRISVDTGAYATGRLTAALIGEGTVRFVST